MLRTISSGGCVFIFPSLVSLCVLMFLKILKMRIFSNEIRVKPTLKVFAQNFKCYSRNLCVLLWKKNHKIQESQLRSGMLLTFGKPFEITPRWKPKFRAIKDDKNNSFGIAIPGNNLGKWLWFKGVLHAIDWTNLKKKSPTQTHQVLGSARVYPNFCDALRVCVCV